MATVTYDDLIVPLEASAILADALTIFDAAKFPAMSWGPTDEPYATLEFESRALADVSKMVAAIGKMGITQDAELAALTLHAKDVFDLDREPAVPTQGTVMLEDTGGAGHTFAAGELIFSDVFNPELTFTNVSPISIAGSGSATPTITAGTPDALHNIQGAHLQLVTEVAGLKLTVTAGLSWITQSGADEESDEKLRARCLSRWATLSTTGSAAAYEHWGLSSSSEINRVRVQEDPSAVDPAPMVTVVLAGTAGPASSTAVAAATAYIGARRPLGTRVLVTPASAYAVTVAGTYKVKAAYATVAAAYISSRLSAWFRGEAITVNGEEIPGLQIGDGVYIAQLVEIIMSAPGVVTCSLVDPGGDLLPNATYPELMPPGAPSDDGVATLVTSSALLVPTLV